MARVLIVEDHAGVRVLVSRLLTRSHEVVEAETAEAALELLRHQDVDVVILDILLPDLDGREVCRRLRADTRLCTLGIIGITASIVDPLSTSDGFDIVLEKPAGIPWLTTAVDLLAARRNRPHTQS